MNDFDKFLHSYDALQAVVDYLYDRKATLEPPEIKNTKVDIHRHEVIEIDLDDVRAADGIQISYDFDRDGYVIKQASIFSWDCSDTENDEDWQEVAFIKAWNRWDHEKNVVPLE